MSDIAYPNIEKCDRIIKEFMDCVKGQRGDDLIVEILGMTSDDVSYIEAKVFQWLCPDEHNRLMLLADSDFLPFMSRMLILGAWLAKHGEAIQRSPSVRGRTQLN